MRLTIKELEEKTFSIRKDLLRLCNKESIHIGGDLSIADIMTVLWQSVINYNPNNPKDENRDRFVLSKSHASAVLSLNQAEIGCFDKELVFDSYAKDGSMFSMHSCNIVNPFVDVSTGSLGHGLPIACGIAAALKLKKSNAKVYTIMGDGEQAEGSIWEAAMNASNYGLSNIVAIIDNNSLGADGELSRYSPVNNLAEKYKSFGWNVYEIDGNSISEIVDVFNTVNNKQIEKPTVIVAKTIKGKGVDFMENNPKWHAGKLNDDEYKKAIESLENAKK